MASPIQHHQTTASPIISQVAYQSGNLGLVNKFIELFPYEVFVAAERATFTALLFIRTEFRIRRVKGLLHSPSFNIAIGMTERIMFLHSCYPLSKKEVTVILIDISHAP
jgi:hypothetical protein